MYLCVVHLVLWVILHLSIPSCNDAWHSVDCVHHENNTHQGFTQDFTSEGEIIASSNIVKLGGSGGMLPQEKFEIYDI